MARQRRDSLVPMSKAGKLAIQAAENSVNTIGAFPSEAGAAAVALFYLGAFNNSIPDWGTSIFERDAQLQRLLTEEPFLASAVASIAARNAGYSWHLEGPDRSTKAAKKNIDNFDYGAGWVPFSMKLATNLLTQDKGAFVEIIRTGDSPSAPWISLANLPSNQCYKTGDPEYPVLFRDRNGKMHRLAWYQVYHLTEMPMDHPTYYGLQLSAISRVLKGVQIWFSIEQYQEEKIGGRHGRAIHLVNGVTRRELESAINLAQSIADNRNLRRYMPPVILPSLSEKGAASVATLELASLPDHFEWEPAFRQFMVLMSMGFLTEYQEFAPMPSGNIGTGRQSDTMDQKARLKGAAIWRKNITQMMNSVIPGNVQFGYDDEDVDEEMRKAQAARTRAQDRKLRFETGELDAQGLRELALASGDLPREIYDAQVARAATMADPAGPQEIVPGPNDVVISDVTEPIGNEPEQGDKGLYQMWKMDLEEALPGV